MRSRRGRFMRLADAWATGWILVIIVLLAAWGIGVLNVGLEEGAPVLLLPAGLFILWLAYLAWKWLW